jgi:uncharacterized protein (TIGR03437 family)
VFFVIVSIGIARSHRRASGRGQAAALHWPDYSVNGSANPASHTSTLMVYLTSGGPTNPPGEDSRIVSGIEHLQLPVRAEIGGWLQRRG